MKSQVIKIGVSSVLFIALIFAALVLVRPIIISFENSLIDFRDSVVQQVEDKTGLKITYKSISPSVLSLFLINNIEIYDSFSDNLLLSIKRASLSYNLGKILQGDFSSAFTRLVVTGISLEYDAIENSNLLEKLMSLVQNTDIQKPLENEILVEDTKEVQKDEIVAVDQKSEQRNNLSENNVKPVAKEKNNKLLPFEVKVKDVSLHYKDSFLDGTVLLKNIDIQNADETNFLNASLNGNIKINLLEPLLNKFSTELAENLEKLSGNFSMDAVLSSNLNGSYGTLDLTNLGSENFRIPSANFLAEYDNNEITVSLLQSSYSIALMASYGLETKNLLFKAEMDSFDPFTFVEIKEGPAIIEKIRGTKLSGDYLFQLNSKQDALSYEATGSLFLPKQLISDSVNIIFSVSGDNKEVYLHNLNVDSNVVAMYMEGSYNIPNMRPSGTAFLQHLKLPNGGTISAEAYVDPLDKGFVCFIPQLFLGEKSFTALQLSVIPDFVSNSLDFSFELSDYSHIEFDSPGIINIAGSIIGEKSPYIQAQVAINDFFIESAIQAGAFFLEEEKKSSVENLAQSFSSFMMTNELYVATDLKSFTYNVPYWIVANTEQDKGLLVFSFTGNESNLNLSGFDLLYGGNTVQLTADVSLDYEFNSAFFLANATVNSIPYDFSGSFMPESGLNITGSYGLDLIVSLDSFVENNLIHGQLRFNELPIALGKPVLLLSTNMFGSVDLDNISDFQVQIESMSVSEATGLLSFSPNLTFGGNINAFGFMLDKFVYNDSVSLLNGSGGLMWNFSSGTLSSASFNLLLNSSIASEAYDISLSISNPELLPFSVHSLMTDFYFSADANISNFPMSRVAQMQIDRNTCSATVSAMGTVENPFVAINIAPSSVSFGGIPFDFNGSAFLDDGQFFLEDANINFGNHSVSNISGDFSLATFSGGISATYDGEISSLYNIHAPISFNLVSSAESDKTGFLGMMDSISKGLPEFIEGKLDINLEGSFFEEPYPVNLSLVKLPGYISVSSRDNLGINGTIATGGIVNIQLDGRMPIHTQIHGIVSNQLLDINLDNVYCDLSVFKNLVYFPYVALYGGILQGSLNIGGILADPDFDGSFNVANLDLNCPDYVTEHIIGKDVQILVKENELRIDSEVFAVKQGKVVMDLYLGMDRWKLDLLSLQIKTPNNIFIPARVSVPPVIIEGNSTCDLDVQVTLNSCDVVGRFYTENVEIQVLTEMISEISNSYAKKEGFRVNLDIDVTTGQHVEVAYNPLIRGLIEPGTNIAFQYDSISKDMNIKSDIVLRGGEITYLNRNFYIREGRVVLNESEDVFDPRLTLRAEIRERDENGEPVRITLFADNQRLSEFNPSYYSSPPKSELEIMTMLGQAVTGDVQSGWDVFFTGVDYGFQVLVLRKIENALRDLLNFDIFSLRTMGLQNSLRQWLNVSSEKEALTLSNLLDNTTVYIGKYFGSSLYADALFHIAYDETMVLSGESSTGLIFQPEVGVEMDSPFGTIRWSLSPEIGSSQNLWTPATSITLSWKFVF